MNHNTDSELLLAYAEQNSEAAFAELVRRYVDLTYSAALRVCNGNLHLAQDATQRAFVALSQNARKLASRPVLAGWLHRTAQNIAAESVRSEIRRRARESQVAAMNTIPDTSEVRWEEIAPHLDAAVAELNDAERDAILLRYFQNKTAREMASLLSISDEAAQKRVARAVDRLRGLFAQRGIALSGAGLGIISANAIQAAPAAVATTISAATAGAFIAPSLLTFMANKTAATALAASLIAINCALVFSLPRVAPAATSSPTPIAQAQPISPRPSIPKPGIPQPPPPPPTQFAAIYSNNAEKFVANLRAIGCPEETIKDILVADIGRRFAAQEETFRPGPADHVPNGWSSSTLEGKLVARRQEAAEIARQKDSALRAALGYEVPVDMPNYAMTVSDQRFQKTLNELPREKRSLAQQIQDRYWSEVSILRNRTRGFWLPEDKEELEQLKLGRDHALSNLVAP